MTDTTAPPLPALTLAELRNHARERLHELEASIGDIKAMQTEARALRAFLKLDIEPEAEADHQAPASRKRQHWTQRPENAKRLRRMHKKGAATRRAKRQGDD